MKLKYLATAAAAMIAASPAFAFLNGPNDPSPELFLTVWSATSASGGTGNINSSYTLDLGVSLLDMIANKSVDKYIDVLLGTDSLFNTFIGTVNTTTAGALQFNVTAGSHGGLGYTSTDVLLSTVAGATLGSVNNLALYTALDQVAPFVDAVNGIGTHGAQANGSSVASGGESLFTVPLSTWQSSIPLNSKAVGTTATFGSYTQNGTGVTPVTAEIFAGKFFLGQSAPNVYSLQYQVAAVPEPTGYALALAGLGLIGFVGARRKS